MAKFQSPLLGYNNNVRHKNRVFHIQTEDSGVNHPHIITHLFMDGGRILKSVKKSYAEHVGIDGMSDIVRTMMKEQHKAMFVALRDGQFDHLFEGGTGGSGSIKPPPKPAAPVVTAPVVTAPAVTAPTVTTPPASLEPATTPDPRPPVVAPTEEEAPATTRAPEPVEVAAAAAPRPVPLPPPAPLPIAPKPMVAPAPAPVAAAKPAASFFQSSDLPPAPSRPPLPKDTSTGARRIAEAIRPPDSAPASSSKPHQRPASDNRVPQARAATLFGTGTRPPPSIFSDELISDKSLDEVILSYLAEDLDPPRRK